MKELKKIMSTYGFKPAYKPNENINWIYGGICGDGYKLQYSKVWAYDNVYFIFEFTHFTDKNINIDFVEYFHTSFNLRKEKENKQYQEVEKFFSELKKSIIKFH